VASQEATLMTLVRSSFLLSENLDNYPPNNEPFSQEIHLKILLLIAGGSKFSNSEPRCRVSVLNFFVKYGK
jgi:hypothetical protein